jgi:hypothetical protein
MVLPLLIMTRGEGGLFGNEPLIKIFRRKRNQGGGEWRKLHKEEFYALYSSQNIIWVRKL